uniref:Uncharacterized protein n=1 Tax=Myoviridae sp. ctBtT5 TaxID=2825048 RepID=A0A8S5PZY5_9CAUD|nr:MAG TPA: hypothetical protein [Myoviridae sp. ctBtT5]
MDSSIKSEYKGRQRQESQLNLLLVLILMGN